jgi:hypothetical protein
MWYQINIKLDGEHFFSTCNITCKSDLERVLSIIEQKFPRKEGYKI